MLQTNVVSQSFVPGSVQWRGYKNTTFSKTENFANYHRPYNLGQWLEIFADHETLVGVKVIQGNDVS